MKEAVYVDILLTVNLFINYFLLLSCAEIMKTDFKRLRILFGAAIGAAASLVIFLPPLSQISELIFKSSLSALIVFTSFGYKSFKRFSKLVFAFFASNMIFAGCMMALWIWLKPKGMVINNDITYFNINIPTLLISCVICYGFVSLISRITVRQNLKKMKYKVSLTFGGNTVNGTGYVDTGNSLKECFSGFPVIVADEKFISALFSPTEKDFLHKGFADTNAPERLKNKVRLIPYGTVGGNGILTAFRPDLAEFRDEKGTVFRTNKIYIAVSKEKFKSFDCDVLLSPKIFENHN